MTTATQVQFIMTPKARLSFANLFKAKPSRFDPTKIGYNCVLIFEPNTDLSRLKALVWTTALTAWGEGKARHPDVQWPFKVLKSSEEKNFVGFPPGSVVINCQSQFQPQLCDQSRQPVISPDVIYSGCYVHVMVNAFAWEKNTKLGVSFGLGNIQKVADGGRLDNRRSIEQDFEPLPGAEAGPSAAQGAGGMPF